MFARPIGLAMMIAACLPAGGCGFTPLYATNAESAQGRLDNIRLESVFGADEAAPYIERAFRRRANGPRSGSAPQYDLVIQADETAAQLAVQIDASVTRFNYRLEGRYTLIDRKDGTQIAGRSEAFASFNIVDSQYSTLFAEREAREKAATALVEQIERDILLKLDQGPEER